MKNAINYYYTMFPNEIHQNDRMYYFYDGYNYYTLIQYDGDLKKANESYEMHMYLLNKGIYIHQIILNRDKRVITLINGLPYIMLKVYPYKGNVNLKEIMNFSYANNTIKIEAPNWGKLWSEKNDYLEYQLSQLGNKYPELRKSFSYFIGIGETSIQLFNSISLENIPLAISHRRIRSTDTLFDFYNPLNLLFDYRVRDSAEYLKSCFFSDNDIYNLTNFYLSRANLSKSECIIFLSRLLYPTYYFDLFENIISGKKSSSEIKKVTEMATAFENYIKKIYMHFRKIYNIQVIEWLES